MRCAFPRFATLGFILGCNVTASLGGGGTSSSTSGAPQPTTAAITDTAPAVSSSTGTTTQSLAEEGTASSSSGEAAHGTGSTSSTSSTSSNSSTSSTSSTSTGLDTPRVCSAPFDDVCLECLQTSCCEPLNTCIETPSCACVLGCLEFAPDFLSCIGGPACQGGAQVQLLTGCAILECAEACGFPASADGAGDFLDAL